MSMTAFSLIATSNLKNPSDSILYNHICFGFYNFLCISFGTMIKSHMIIEVDVIEVINIEVDVAANEQLSDIYSIFTFLIV